MLAQRIATAVVGVPLIFLLILVGGNWYVAFVAAALAIASLEFQHPRLGWLHHVSLLAAAFCAAMASGAHVGLNWVLWFMAGAILLTLAASLIPFDADRMLTDWLWTIGGIAYVGFLGSFIVLLRDFPNGRDWVYLALFSTFSVDTTAYFTGRAFGSHPLAPAISPKKTVEGFVGGYAGGFAAVLLLNYFLGLRIEASQAVLLGLVFPLAATVGDLAESGIKRSMHIKDASELIPGHGGVLDRLDSILFT
ncbi:MAG: phosphatidate cytidylyltransferase, partial [Dehalococcoidia bacterium]